MSQFIAIDIGGTQIRAGRYSHNDRTPLQVEKTTTHFGDEPAIQRLYNLIDSVLPPNGEIAAIAVAAPGPVDPYAGVLREAPNIPEWDNFPLRQLIEDRFHVPVALGNDANLAAMGEWRFGAGRGHHHLIYMTVSTGIGGGVITDDRLLLGVRGLAAEMGHITIVPDGPMCGCGHRGHLEALASGPAMARWVEGELANGIPSALGGKGALNARMIAEAAQQGDRLAIAALERSGAFIGQALADYLHLFNPSIVIIGGGVSRSGKFLFEPMQAAMRENVITPYYLENLTLTTAELGDDAGLIGALALAHELQEKTLQSSR